MKHDAKLAYESLQTVCFEQRRWRVHVLLVTGPGRCQSLLNMFVCVWATNHQGKPTSTLLGFSCRNNLSVPFLGWFKGELL